MTEGVAALQNSPDEHHVHPSHDNTGDMALPPNMDLSKIPIAANPSGEPPNFEGGPSMYHGMLDSGIALIVVGGLFLIVRLATNLKVARKVGLDDREFSSCFVPQGCANKGRSALRLCICWRSGLLGSQSLQ
jgi:hypothetical protein